MNTPVPKSANEAFERFRKLTQQVVSTPKVKVDELAKKKAEAKPFTPKSA